MRRMFGLIFLLLLLSNLYSNDFKAKATSEVIIKGNLNSGTSIYKTKMSEADKREATWKTSIDTFDSKGNIHPLLLEYKKIKKNQWLVKASLADSKKPVAIYAKKESAFPPNVDDKFILVFNKQGKLKKIIDSQSNSKKNRTI